ncbi:DUF4360 domain-containing protein [Sorangium sp. So ce1036]|jgi:hypothetical protein|nr:DUF4360 domain-containing protein [Sorangium cellulosum]
MKKATCHGAVAALAAGLFCAAPAGRARAQERPEGVRIERLMYRGTGCRQGTADAQIVGGGTAFIIVFTEFNAQAGPSASPSEGRSRCNVSVHLRYPEGWSFTAASVVYRGNAILGPRVSARMGARYNFPGTPSSSAEVELTGFATEDFELLRQFDTARWSPCARRGALPVNVLATVEVSNRQDRSSSGLITVEQHDGTFDLQLNLRWRRC